MDAIVSARVPIALKERGNGILHDIGSTPTQLINAATSSFSRSTSCPSPMILSRGCGARSAS